MKIFKRIVAGKGVRGTPKLLSEALNIKLLNKNTSWGHHLVRAPILVNWGCTSASFPDHLKHYPHLNNYQSVSDASSKMQTFHKLNAYNIDTVEHTQDHQEASLWLQEGVVLGRDLDRGNSGRGITVYEPGEALGQHLFYVKYFKARHEYRVHVGKTDEGFVVIDSQRKSLRTDEQRPEDPSFYIRNHDNGFIFERGAVSGGLPEVVQSEAIGAIMALGLDFGAVDIRYNDREDTCAVLEINTAPGLSGTTLENYVNYFQLFFTNHL